MAQLHDLSAIEQGAAIRGRVVSAVELAQHYLARSEQYGPSVGAFVTLTPELALAQARAADARLAAGDPADLSPLLGVVCPVKDLNSVAGVPTTFGSAGFVVTPPTDDNAVAAMRAAGLVFTGKTNTPEFGFPNYTEPEVAPPARTPWDLTRSAAGSSGGAAAAVAAGLAPIAQGNDGGGSIRLPASVCGLVGLKPSRGRVSNGPAADGVGDLVAIGPLARTVRDAAALLDVLATEFVGDPFRAAPVPGSFLSAAGEDPGRLRVGVFTTPVVGHVDAAAEVLTAVSDTVDLLTGLGHEVVEIPPPIPASAVAEFEVVWASLADSLPLPPEVEKQLRPLTSMLRERARGISSGRLAGAVSAMRGIARQAMIATEPFDVVLSPTASAPPFLVGQLRDDDDPDADFEAQKDWAGYTAIYNVTGQPSINVPLNWTDRDLPIGVQFAARTGAERLLIALAAELEEARPWAHRRPTIW
jgi:amidase